MTFSDVMRNAQERPFDDVADTSPEPFRELLNVFLLGVASQWRVRADENWCHAEPVAQLPATARVQGWKLHVSSTVGDAGRVLEAVLPVLVAARCAFKFARTTRVLSRMNDAHAAREGSGKFLTVYPAADGDLPGLASRLDSVTAGLDGPAILSDACYRPMSLVHLRYGAFSGIPLLSADGEVLAGIRDPAGQVVTDRREPRFTPPSWARYPLPSPPAPPPSGQVLLDGRFLVRRAIRHANKGGVFVAEDRASGQEVIVKQARRHVGGGTRGGDVVALLRREESALRALARHGRTPRPLGLFEQGGDLFLAQEYLPGVTLRRWLADHRADLGPTADRPALAGLAAGIADLVALVHADGFVLRDLSPNNILVSPPGQVWMVDLEHAIGVPVAGHDGGRGAGTAGYMAPEQACGAAPHPSADVFGLGALTCLLFTGEDPVPAAGLPLGGDYQDGLVAGWLAAPGRRLLVPAGARELIEACTAPDPRARPDAATAAKALHGLRPGRAPAPRQVVAAALTGLAPRPAGLPGVVRDLAATMTSALRLGPQATAAPQDAFSRLFASPGFGSVSDPRNVQHGAAGACGVLAEMYRRTSDPRLGEATAGAAQWLLARTGPPRGPVGLYFGGSGPAWALAAAGRALDRPELLAAAVEVALGQDPGWPSPDLTHGRAGLGLTLWELWRHTGDERLLGRVAVVADSLVADAERAADGTVSWHAPAWSGSRLAGKRFYGLAHGTAGIGLFLLETATVTGHQDYAELAAAAVDTLLARATAVAGTLNWSSDPGDPSTEAAYWCNGAGGVATFLARAYTRTGDRRLPAVLDGAARAMMSRKWRLGLAYCHGLAGNGDTLLETAEVLGRPQHGAWAADLGAMTVAAVRRDSRDSRGSVAGSAPAGPDVAMVADFQVGLGGVLAFLARLDVPGPRLWLPPLYPGPAAATGAAVPAQAGRAAPGPPPRP
jgi:hypothetical protein